VRKRLLLVAATTGYQTRSFAAAARRLGLELTLATDRCHVLDDPWHDRAVPVRFHSIPWSISQIRKSGQYGGVLAVGDRPALVAAHAAQELGIPFHRPEAVRSSRDKFLMRRKLRAEGLPVPAFLRLPVTADRRKAAAGVPYPCVLKPLTLSASQGVIRADSPGEFVSAFTRITSLLQKPEMRVARDPSMGFIQVEEYIPGIEFAVEAVATGGRVRVLAVFDKPDPLCGPYFEESIYVTPSRSRAVDSVVQAFEYGVQALGLTDGPLHGEVRWNERGPWILEIAPRPIGGLCANVLRFEDGSSLESLLVRNAIGEDTGQLRVRPGAAGVMMIPVPQAGIFAGVDGLAQAASLPGIESIDITAKEGQLLLPWPEGSSYLGFIFSTAGDPRAAERLLREAHALLRFRFHRQLPVAG
jgi:biotin carboxylase